MISHIRSRCFPCILIATALVLTAGCRGQHGRVSVQNDEGEPVVKGGVVSAFRMNDPAAQSQLVKGVYGVEGGGWRWTAGSFSVLLKTPPGAAQSGGLLTFSLLVSGDILKQVQAQTITASAGGKVLKSEKYTDAGNHTFSADVPASALTGDTVLIDFSVDKPLPPGPADRRELAVVATAVGIESK